MDTELNNRGAFNLPIKTLLIQYFLTVTAAVLFALVLHTTLIKYLDVYHTVLELSCVFISVSTFFAVWFTYNNGTTSSYVLGLKMLKKP
ncbi:hypothetical protein [Pseudobacteroides cellulosolvens]|uniref:Uncharacterized protein n=1 Tax=Pseudobacteroides cellulosolvens ATCC 35603 = DSM 2933 TaxID=398512 RepID=A0A0L6JNN8_9FIRM|nr:hypothetical protein [Pseudobacteroides cellulosolvens]KNY27446.1 hypothetical protein Bccel_2717 [Pseudobacteroides cellulosolvens ATCC 35603 = DSM 2933]